MINIISNLILTVLRFFSWIPGVDTQAAVWGVNALAIFILIAFLEVWLRKAVPGKLFVEGGWLWSIVFVVGVAFNISSDWKLWLIGIVMILVALWKARLFGAKGSEKRTAKSAIRQALDKINAWLDEEEIPHQPTPKRSFGSFSKKRKEEKENVPDWDAPL